MADIRPISYRLELTPNLSTFRFAGNVEILLHARSRVIDIVLNASELAIWRCRVQIGSRWVNCPFFMSPQKETVKIGLPDKMKGEIRLQIDYDGIINDRMGGWYRSGYTSEGRSTFMAVTQFQESFARQVLPCFDSPEMKATFDVTLVVDQKLTALSNEEIADEIRIAGGKKRIRFRQNPIMSPYLLFFGVGEFDRITHEKDHRVRAITTPGATEAARFGLEFGEKSLAFCESYFKIPYPLSKMDLIAVPDFAFGAMENWGAITFRENLLLYDAEKTSQAGVARICEVIAHEIVHQWFGNLASPSDWKYLWLNESFATYTSYDIVNHYYPEWNTWEQFVYSQSAPALERDGLNETLSIELPGGEQIVINTATAPIIYNKGGSVLRQMRGYLGDDRYREGLVRYLKAHAYDCAASADLWGAFEKAAHKPVTALMKRWIEQPGFPLVTVRENSQDRITLHQQRFTYLPSSDEFAGSAPNAPWIIPIRLNWIGPEWGPRIDEFLMDAEEMEIEKPSGATAVKINAGQTGFYRVRYEDARALQQLGPLISEKQLDRFDRWGLQDDLFALVRRGTERIETYLEFLQFYEEEDAFLTLMSIADHLHFTRLISQGTSAAAVNGFGRVFFEHVLSRIGFEPRAGDPHTTAILRDHLLFLAALFGSETISDFAGEQFTALTIGQKVHPDIQKSVMQIGALLNPDAAIGWLTQRMETSESEHERMNILSALGCLQNETHIHEALSYTLDSVAPRNKHIPMAAFAVNPKAASLMWPWYLENRQRMESFHPLIFERIISTIIPIGGMTWASDIREFFKDDPGKTPAAASVIKMSLEKLAINERMRAAHA